MNAPRAFDDRRIVFEDADLIVVDKPPGVPCQAVDQAERDDLPYRLEQHLRQRDGSRPYVGIHQRLDQDTSGLILYSKTKRVNRELARQFEERRISKTYLAVVEGWRGKGKTLRSRLDRGRDGRSRVVGRGGKSAVSHVSVQRRTGGRALVEVRIETGRTHQIRAQLEHEGAPIVGDNVYGGAACARLLLHAWKLELLHPASGQPLRLEAPVPRGFEAAMRGETRDLSAAALSEALELAQERRWGLSAHAGTDAFRLLNEGGDGFEGLAVDVYGAWHVAHFYEPALERPEILDAIAQLGGRGVYVKRRPRQANTLVDGRDDSVAPSDPIRGASAPEALAVREHGVPYTVRLGEGLSTGLFLDQRENRVRVRTMASGARVLNLFSYTCGFTVAAAVGGAVETVSVDASKRLLDWGRTNLREAGVDSDAHRMVHADVFDHLRRLARTGAVFDLVCVDPPTYSKTRSTRWKSGRAWIGLFSAVLRVTAPGGSVLACSNDRRMSIGAFRRFAREGSREAGAELEQLKDLRCPRDFPPAPGREAHLKSLLLRRRA